ncbi:hypothetical protein NMY22_g5721 [Coprinellus aureogranulatus]|nr:hypothetical protein NMY22_g5721 [Coprinellus aureogranulatus]
MGLPSPAGQTINLVRSKPKAWSKEEWGTWAKSHKLALEAKYSGSASRRVHRRASGTNYTHYIAHPFQQLIAFPSHSYFGSLAIGTPPVSYNVILDTGSADLWVAGENCTSCGDVSTFDPSSSSSFQNQSTPFSITYGSGEAAGFLAQDVVQMAGFQVENQVFAICDEVSSGLLTEPVSGLLGLAFQTIASSKAPPFWETLASEDAWDSPIMAFHLTRYLNASDVRTLERGGSFSMGFANSSLYTGDIDYVDLPVQGSYWILPITSEPTFDVAIRITVNNNSINAPAGEQAYAAIDTGTTLVGGPSSVIGEIFAQIPDARPGTGDFESYYTYPCDTQVTVEIAFGGRSWPISPADFELARLTHDTCLGALFEITSGGSAPAWIVGDTFLKMCIQSFDIRQPR